PRSTTTSGRSSLPRRRSASRRSRPYRARASRSATTRAARTWSSGRSSRSPEYSWAVTPQRRTALVSVLAATALIGLKLGTGIATHSLGLLSEAAHSGIDLIAALLTFFAVGVAARPADTGHQYGHGKAEHLSALAEGAILVIASLFIVWRAIARLAGTTHPHVSATWWALVVIVVVIGLDLARTIAS